MGCDIHTYIEVQRTVSNELAWQCADRFELNKYFDPKDDSDKWGQEYNVDPVYSDRNYTLFSALAGVRYYGNEVALLSEPRGMPDDCNQVIKDHNERWDADGHSHSYCTLQELYDYQDENSKVTYKGLISPEQAKDLDENGTHPRSWCQGTSDQSYIKREWTVEEDVLKFFVEAIEKRARKDHWIFWKDDERVEREKAEKTRVVFWFDN